MTTPSNHPTDDILDRATNELRTESPLPGPAAELLATTSSTLFAHSINAPELVQKDLDGTHLNSNARSNQGRKERMLRIFRISGLAATVMLVLATIAFVALSNRNTANAFEQAKEKARKAKSVSYRMTIETDQERKEELHFIAGEFHRRETRSFTLLEPNTGVITIPQLLIPTIVPSKPVYATTPYHIDFLITNYKTKQSLRLTEVVFEKTKTAEKWIGSQDSKAKSPLDEMEGINSLSSNDMEKTGEEIIEGRKNYVYDSKKTASTTSDPQVDVKIKDSKTWIDAETSSITRIKIKFVVSKSISYAMILDNFKWNEPIDEKLFSFEVPEGYELSSSISPPTKQGSIAILGQVIENIKKAVSMTCIQKRTSDGVESVTVATLSGDWMRGETKGNVQGVVGQIFNFRTYERLRLIVIGDRKFALRGAPTQTQNTKLPESFILNFYSSLAESKDAKFVGEESLNGRVTHLYQVSIPGMGDGRVWVDPRTNLPAKTSFQTTYEIVDKDGKKSKQVADTVAEEIQWNIPVSEEFFTKPRGFKVFDEKDPKAEEEMKAAEKARQATISKSTKKDE